MEEWLDILWFKIVDSVHYVVSFLDFIFAPLNSLGPAFAISTISFITVVITRCLSRAFKTNRYKELKKEFFYWYQIRQEALKGDDPEKAKSLAKNIDQAKLNKVYYDYFFEGLLIGIATRVLPILLFLAYVNEAYKPDNLLKLFGRDYVFRLKNLEGGSILVGSVLWFVLSLFLVYVGWAIIVRVYSKYATREKS